MTDNRKVVVMVTPEFLHNEDLNLFAARITPLGLTGYGESRDAASAKIKRMFAAWVKGRRIVGDLEERLNISGLEWHWLDEYSGDNSVEIVQSAKLQSKTATVKSAATSTNWQIISKEFGIAA